MYVKWELGGFGRNDLLSLLIVSNECHQKTEEWLSKAGQETLYDGSEEL